MSAVKVHKASQGALQQIIVAGAHQLLADEPTTLGGDDAGLAPFDLLDAALGACTAITVQMVAQRRQYPLQDVRVEITHETVDGVFKLHRRVELVGELSAEQREFLLGIANKCPVHRALSGPIEIDTESV